MARALTTRFRLISLIPEHSQLNQVSAASNAYSSASRTTLCYSCLLSQCKPILAPKKALKNDLFFYSNQTLSQGETANASKKSTPEPEEGALLAKQFSDNLKRHTDFSKIDAFEAESPPRITELTAEDKKIFAIRPAPQPSFNLAAYVNQSETLQKFLQMGINISKWDRKGKLPDLIVRLDFERDVKPRLIFLKEVAGVDDETFPKFISINPWIFKESLEDLQVRLNYLEAKQFSKEEIAIIVSKAPFWLSMSTQKVDERIGWYQHEFNLTGKDVRYIIVKLPKLVTWDMDQIKKLRFDMKEFMAFSDTQLKRILKFTPKLFISDGNKIIKTFNYLFDEMKINQEAIANYPAILRFRPLLLRQRHLYLKHLKRDQFDPTTENFISLKMMAVPNDRAFCEEVVKTSIDDYHKFLKTI